jgi:hypothetical protein
LTFGWPNTKKYLGGIPHDISGDLLLEAGMLSDRQQKPILQKQKMDLDFKETVTGFATRAGRMNRLSKCKVIFE